jgi:putative transport protein
MLCEIILIWLSSWLSLSVISSGSLGFGTFKLGPLGGCLLAALAVGQFGIAVPGVLGRIPSLSVFLFAVGYKTGPQFFRVLRRNALPH